MPQDLFSHLHFDPAQGHIWLAGKRMMLLHARAFALLRREVIDALGLEQARAIFTRQGYHSGALDAESAARLRPHATIDDMFAVGPELHMLEGMVRSEALHVEFDVGRGAFSAEYLWHGSSECGAHLETAGRGAYPAGWSLAGYASGYASVFLGRPILFREVECIAMGHPHCRVQGRPAEEWEEGEEDLRFMRGEAINQIERARSSARGGSEQRIVGASAGFNVAFDMLHHVADTDAVVLFLGESGVGKEIFARNLHAMGRRADKPFVAVNCAAIPESLLEAELFGVEKGAFTGAHAARAGRFERAEGGTLFLDEIATLSLAAQGKLLRAIQEGEFERVGGVRMHRANVRLVAATNVDLRAAVEAGTFRADLFYRLNVFPIRIPPLRERRADLPLLMEYFLERYSTRYGKAVTGFEGDAVAAMLGYGWPGNIRELENVIERGVIMARDGEPLRLHHIFGGGEALGPLPFRVRAGGRVENGQTAQEGDDLDLARSERRMIEQALARSGGNKARAARLLGITRAQLYYRLEQMGSTS
ncbi:MULTISPECIES: sigma-54-dependent Fis family transcriptional regulator [unclassified Novosphingobium]|nr:MULTISPECIES: sigma-54-dependent Fis family transcriptional regulator [unclassified Novosphingobium]MDR6708815.1 DNA-binding NtrC family response regulator [Novosphingobium sp. 1748]ODU82936.1 MAG: sigma-54-dependent Fis family transcriptional regulator [Novosphingobium sp. SCN 63-17]OJX96835.1 MAG: sigma-54-dependent Fis family transcriptional regulator [Novosphingobium sp. 63-713]